MATGDVHNKFCKIGAAVPEICSQTDRQTDRQTDHNTLLPYRGGLIRTNTLYSIDHIGYISNRSDTELTYELD